MFCYGLFPKPKHHPFRFDDFAAGWRLEDVRRIRRDALASDEGPIYFGLASAEVEKAPFEVASAEIQLGRELGARSISCHVAYGAYSSAFGKPWVTRVAQERLLGPDILLVHGNSPTRHELKVIADSGAAVSATPGVEMQMGMGRPVVGRALAAGVKLGLGVDIVLNIPGDMLGLMRTVLAEERAARNDPLVAFDQVPRRPGFDCRDVVSLATAGVARVTNLESEIGSLTPGKRADVIGVRQNSLNMIQNRGPFSALVHYATAADVDIVVVDGTLRKRDGRLVGPDAAGVVSQVEASRERIESRFISLDRDDLEDYYKGRYNFGN